MKLGSRFCLILEYLAAEDHRAVDDDVPCLDYDKFCLLFLRWCHVVPRQVRRVDWYISLNFMSQDERRKACVEAVIDAIAAKQRAGERRTFDEGAKATLRCIMRCYGYERYDIGSAQLLWIETYSTVSTQHKFMKAAWILLEYILIFPDRRAPYWEMRHAPNRVKAARCGIDGMKLDVLKLQREIRAWQEETGQPSMPTVDQNASLRNRIDIGAGYAEKIAQPSVSGVNFGDATCWRLAWSRWGWVGRRYVAIRFWACWIFFDSRMVGRWGLVEIVLFCR